MKHADVLVIGGGIAGISAAAHLAEDARVIVLEAEPRLGTHATGRSAALFIRNYGNATLRALNAAALPVFEGDTDLSDAPLLSPRGMLFVAEEEDVPRLDAYAAGATGLSRPSVAEVVRHVPILRPERIASALYEADAQDIDVEALLQGYARRAKARGAEIMPNARVRSLGRVGGIWTADTAQEAYAAPIVVNASGAWADVVAEAAGVGTLGLTPCRRSGALIPAPDGHDIRRWPLFASIREDWYAKPSGGALFVSPADEDPVQPGDAAPDDMVLAEGLHRYEQAVTSPVRRVTHSWAGLRTFAPDHTPVVGFDGSADGFFWLAGQGGYGIQTAPAMAALAAALVGGRVPAIDPAVVAALSPSRPALASAG